MRKTAFLFACLAALMLAAPAALAGGDGWFLGFDLMAARPSNLPTAFTVDDPNGGYYQNGDVISVDPSYDFAGRVFFGQVFSGGDGWVISFTSLEASENEEVKSSGNGELWDILMHADYTMDGYDGIAEAEAETEATSFEVAYFHPVHEGDRLHTSVHAGLRYASLDHDLAAHYDDGSYCSEVELDSETTGIGVSLGMMGGVKINDRLWFGGGGAISYLAGNTESSTFFDSEYAGDILADIDRDNDRAFSIVEVGVGLKYQVTDSFYLRFGYEFAQWNNVVTTNLYPDDVAEGFISTGITDVTWDTFFVGGVFKFGNEG